MTPYLTTADAAAKLGVNERPGDLYADQVGLEENAGKYR